MFIDKIIILIIILTLPSSFLLLNPAYNSESTDLSLVNHVKYITKEIGPRPAGSESEMETASYLKSKFDAYGVKTEIHEFQYYSMNSKQIKKSKNVIGTINGTSPQQIIICADLDTFKDQNTGKYTEGANDDATGLAVLIGLAEKYKNKKPFYTIKLIGFGAGEDEYTFPVNVSPRTSLEEDEYNKIMYTPYLVGARYYMLQNQDSVNNIVAVISLEAVGTGDPCFISEDSYTQNNQSFVNFLVLNARDSGIKAEKIDFMTYKIPSGRDAPISHIYLPFSYANIPSTFLTCMNNPDINSAVHGDQEIPGYLTIEDSYENLVENNGGEEELEKQLEKVLYVVENSIDRISVFDALKNKRIE